MAFFGRLGNILRNAANRRISPELRSSPSVFQAIRCMCSAPSSKLFIGGVSYSTDEQSLREAFSKYGEVVDARIIMDRESGRSRGFGFITYNSVEEAASAIQALDGQDLHGRRVRVNYANDRPRGYGGGFGGSYGNTQYGAGAGAGYAGAYGSSPYGGGGGGGGGGYGGNVGGGYGGGGYGGGGYGSGGNYGGSGSANDYAADSAGGSGMNYGNDGKFASGNTYTDGSSGGYGGNGGNFGDAGGVGKYESSAGFPSSDNYGSAGGGGSYGFPSSGHDGSSVDGSGGTGTGGYDGSAGSEYASSGQFDTKESSNVDEDLGGFGDSLEGNYKDDDDDTDNFAKRA
ncbi:glycine-rich RNA-binding protein 3, mitochondrial-like isoform X2 [Gastrolobium bilobum]|nr:glycine-rich RNA-binding protein 3, mitochondrial-like isoform X2 [Gastrolobium bilobum]XP_061364925.1 glycine-rich RNA-binding protein 3, mitochondrial-like isoform X2 [Gastrolobium bilobum]